MGNTKTPEYELHPPTLYESQLFRRGIIKATDSELDLRESYITNLSGPRGGGKTTSLALICMGSLVVGLRALTNFPLAFYCIMDVTGSGEKKFFESQLINLKDIISKKVTIENAIVGLDEYQDIASAYAYNTTKNKILAAMWAQIRKDESSFAYTSKFRKWVDTRTRDELDIEFKCQDARRTHWGRKRYSKGEMVFWQMADWSGNLTGYPFEEYPILRPFKFYSKPIWGSFPTKFRIDIFESMRGMTLDLDKDVITDKSLNEIDYDAVIEQAKLVFAKSERWSPNDFWAEMGVFSQRDQAMIRKVLRENLGFHIPNPNRPMYMLGGTKQEQSEDKEFVASGIA